MRYAITVLATMVLAAPALAQAPAAPATPGTPGAGGQEEMMKTMRRAAYNQLGVLEYCQGRGAVSADTVALQKRMIGMLPPGQTDGLDAAEAAGKGGKVQMMGNEVTLADAATRQGSTPEALCKQMETMLQSQAANLPKP